MPIEVGFWRINDTKVNKVSFSAIETEQKLEDILFNDISIISEDLLLIGRQIITTYGKKIDLLTIDEYGKVSIIELKKNKTSREVVAQIIDYASWVQDLSYKDIIELFNEKNKEPFEKVFEEKFGVPPPEKINQEHEMIIVCSEVDNETERIIDYLSDNYNVPINIVFFRFFRDDNSEYLSRSWLIDPTEVEEKYSRSKQQNKSESWNGKDFIVNIDTGEDGTSSWEDSVKYGFISAGGGKWYSRSLNQLEPGHRIFAMIPKKGYLGVGTVMEKSVRAGEFFIEDEKGNNKSILEMPLICKDLKRTPDNLETCQYFVKVNWIIIKKESEAYWEKGLRANQNSAFKLKNAYTLEKLIDHFNIDD